jgi:hypothetical protein
LTTAIVLNPKTGFTITDAQMAAQSVTGATVEWGTTSGGPYPSSYAVPAATVATDQASGVIVVPIASVPLPAGVSYCVATVTNAAGVSAVSDEVGVQILAVPTAPTLAVA